MPTAEEAHLLGMEGVDNAKRWLEATTRFEILYTVYDDPVRVTLDLLNGKTKRFDMYGRHRDEHLENPHDVYFEVKNVTTAQDQGKEYPQFVARAYSATEAA